MRTSSVVYGLIMSSVLITGGTGWIGRALMVNRPEGIDASPIGRSTTVAGLWDYVIHLAPVDPTPWLEFAADRMLFMSSGAARNPVTDYGKQKRAWERIALDAGGVVARGYTFIGPHMPLDGPYAIGNFIRDGLNGGPIRVKGNGKAIRSYLYETDMARWLWSLLDKDGIFEIGSPFGFTTGTVARMVSNAFGGMPEVIIENQPGEPCETYLPSGEFPSGVGQMVGLQDAIEMTVAALRS